jgi:IS5 family transposase
MSQVRARVEHIFAFMKNSMIGMYLHIRDLGRVSAGIGLMNMVYNLFKCLNLMTQGYGEGCGVTNRKRMGTTSTEKGLH